MNPDIITSAKKPQDLPIAHELRGASELCAMLDALASLVRSQTETFARTLILTIASAPPLRALESFVERHLAADEVRLHAIEAGAMTHALRVRARLTEAEQRLLDDLLSDDRIEQVLARIVHRTEDDALEILRRELGTNEPVFSAASLARQIGSVRGLLTTEEYDRVIMRLPHFSSEELQALHSHLRAMTPADAAMLLRSYLRPVRS